MFMYWKIVIEFKCLNCISKCDFQEDYSSSYMEGRLESVGVWDCYQLLLRILRIYFESQNKSSDIGKEKVFIG